jgi:hypothetical protein
MVDSTTERKQFDTELHRELYELCEAAEAADRAAWEAETLGKHNRHELGMERLERQGDVIAYEFRLGSAFFLLFRSAERANSCGLRDLLLRVLKPEIDRLESDIDAVAEGVVELRRARA